MARIYGLETEYGLSARSDGRRLAPDEAAQRLFAPLASEYASTNVFLPNGGRLYLDVGSHPEYATPECTDPHDLLVADRAGDDVLVGLAARARDAEAALGRDTTFTLVKNNIDAWGNTYGSHENYSVGRDVDPRRLSDWLVPFLVSRQLIAGAGRWHRGAFTLSQRCDAHGQVVSNQTTRSRPLINTRDEPHADPARYRRLHVISGDSTLTEATTWLKIVATELVLRLAESGDAADAAPPVVLADPLDALRAWCRDPDAPRPDADGRPVTCFDAQHRYLGLTERVADTDALRRGWEQWRDALAGLAAGRSAGVEWSVGVGWSVGVEWAVKRRVLQAWRLRHGATPEDSRLAELDLRWHRLGVLPDGRPAGLARLLESRGELPRLTTDAEVRAALEVAPSASRARVRGRLIAVAREAGRDVAADWASFTVRDLGAPSSAPDPGSAGVGGRRPVEVRLDLPDPFAPDDPAADALAARMASEPRVRLLRGFTPPAD